MTRRWRHPDLRSSLHVHVQRTTQLYLQATSAIVAYTLDRRGERQFLVAAIDNDLCTVFLQQNLHFCRGEMF